MPAAGLGGIVPVHYVMALRLGIVQSAPVGAIVDGEESVPLVAHGIDVKSDFSGTKVIRSAGLSLPLDVLLRDNRLQAPPFSCLMKLPVLAVVAVVRFFCGEVAALSEHTTIDAVQTVVGTVLQLAGERIEFL